MATSKLQMHPFLLFWMGVLTGALVIGLLFLYRMYGTELGADLLRGRYVVPQTTPTIDANLQEWGGGGEWLPQDTVQWGGGGEWLTR